MHLFSVFFWEGEGSFLIDKGCSLVYLPCFLLKSVRIAQCDEGSLRLISFQTSSPEMHCTVSM